MKAERWNQIAARANTCSAIPSEMAKELLTYTEDLRMKIESAFRAAYEEGAYSSFCSDEEAKEATDQAWKQFNEKEEG